MSLFAKDQRSLTIAMMAAVAAAAYNNLSVSAALPAIGDDLAKLDLLPWVVTTELVTSAIAVLAIGPVIDSIGTKAVFRTSIVAFAVSSAACAFAPSIEFLIAARGIQGLTTGAIIANVMAAIGLGVPHALRARAYATNSTVWGIMGVGGPTLAAALLSVASWQAIFLVNLPVAMLAGLIGWRAFPGVGEEPGEARADRIGLALVVCFTIFGLGAVSTLQWWTPIAVAGAALCVWLYVRHERSARAPVLRVRHLTDRSLRLLHGIGFLTISSGICANTFLPVYIKGVRGTSTAQAAFAVVFLTVGWTSGAFISSRISERRNGEFAIICAVSMLTFAATATALSVATASPLAAVFAGYFGYGLAMGGASSAGVAVLQAKALPEEMGRVSSAHQFIRTLGFAYGAALSGALIFVTVARELGNADIVRGLLRNDVSAVPDGAVDALERGFTLSAVVAAGLSYLALALASRLRVGQVGSTNE